MAENLSKLSREDISRLERTISEAKDLTARQEEILEKVLAGEKKIGELRITYLKKYLDAYSKSLDATISRKTSDLEDLFLILDRKATQSFLAATSEIEKAKKNSGGGRKPPNSGNGGNTPPPSGGNTPPPSGSNKDVAVNQKVSDENKNKLAEITYDDLKNKADQWAKFFQQNEEARRNIIESEQAYLEAIEERRQSNREAQLKNHANKIKEIEESIMDLEILRHQEENDLQEQVTEYRLSQIQKVTSAEIAAQSLINNIGTELAYANGETLSYGKNGLEINEAGEARAREAEAKDKLKQAKIFEDNINKYRARKELEARRKNNGILSKEDATKIEKELAKRFTLEKLNDKKRIEARLKLETEQARKAEREELSKGVGALTKKGSSFNERKQAWQELTHDESGEKDTEKAVSAALVAVSDLATQLESQIDEIAKYKGAVDTRLQGSSNQRSSGSYWDQLVKDMTSVGAINPYFKQENFANNIKDLVNKGIAFDLKQRAFLMTIQDKIATTFDVADGTLLRLIRIQQEDSTAGRLGMESALNSYLNNMYETSEYLSTVADNVRGSLEEMQSLMQGAEATEVEYQVQKWLGSLYSVGMSQNAVQNISDTLGKIASGQIEGLTGSGASNLLIMAANDAGLSIADILTDGIDASDTNKLLQASVNYLAELADSAKDNKVVQQQLADVFGVKASDLRAATNLVLPGTANSIYGNSLTYGNMLSQLSAMAGSMGNRTSMAEMMTNFWENGKYTLAGSMASNPVSYFIYKMATVLDEAAGGIDLPFINVMGFGVDLNTTVSDLMRLAAVGGGILGSLGPIISGLGSSFSGQAMLNKLGISSGSGLAVTPRGEGGGLLSDSTNRNALSTSGSGYIGNSSGNDIKNSTIQESEDSKKQQMIEAKEEEEANQVTILNNTVLKIYELLDDVAHGSGCFKVKVEGYGLTKAGSSSGGAQGGVGGAGALSGGSSGSSSLGGVGSNGSFGGSANSGGVSGSVDFGSWTTTA